jgi:hypothetical protein
MTLSNWKHRRVSMAERPQPYDRVGTKGASSALSRRGECVTDVDQVIGDDAQADPALNAGQAFVATAVQAMTALEETDPGTGPPRRDCRSQYSVCRPSHRTRNRMSIPLLYSLACESSRSPSRVKVKVPRGI